MAEDVVESANVTLRRKAVRGVAAYFVQNLGGRILTIGGQLVLAALLRPGDFGAIGLALTISTIGAAVADIGIDQVLIQRHRTLRFWLRSANAFSMAVGGVCYVLTLLGAWIGSLVYGAPETFPLAAIMALAIPATSLCLVPMVVMRSNMQFGFLSQVAFAEVVVIQLLSIVLAFAGLGAYALAIPIPLAAAVRCAAFWATARPRIDGQAKLRRLRYLLPNVTGAFGTRVITALVGQGDYVILGLMYPAQVVGYYFFAFRFAAQPLQVLTAGLTAVMLPALSQLRGNRRAQGEAALRAATLLGLAVMPAACLQAIMAGPVLHLLFGDKWAPSVTLLRLLSVGLSADSVAWVAGALLLASGGFRQSLIYSAIFSPPFFVFVAIGAWFGAALGAAIGATMFYLLLPPLYSVLVFRAHGISVPRVATAYGMPAILSVVAMFGMEALLNQAGVTGDLPRILLLPLSLLPYGVLVCLCTPRAAREALAAVRQLVSRGPRRSAAALRDPVGKDVANSV